MSTPIVDIDLQAFWRDPYPVLSDMRTRTPICFVPQLNATLINLHKDIVECEKMVDVFSSSQPGGLMNVLMGENMMRKDYDAHIVERRQAQPALSPKAVKTVWQQHMVKTTQSVLNDLADSDTCDLVTDFAMPVSAHALRHITGLTNMTPEQLDRCSQAMIDGIANYAGDASVEQACNDATAFIDRCIDEMLLPDSALAEHSLLSVLQRSTQPMESIRANIKLAISGGQNEPRDAIAGAVWALLKHPEQLNSIINGQHSWLNAFEEYARWVSPIGMSPRRIAKPYTRGDASFNAESRAFLMFSSGNRDSDVFDKADSFDISRKSVNNISFGAGPHFCAGAAASKMLIGQVALPMLFEKFPDIALASPVEFGGWAFRGPLSMQVTLK